LPNLDPVTQRPTNPHHVHEFEPQEFKNLLSRFFPFVTLGGQSSAFPCELHDDFDASSDSYMIGLIANDARTLRQLGSVLLPKRCLQIKQELEKIHRRHQAHQPRAPRLLLVPLGDVTCTNPADRRRIELIRRELRQSGYETAVVSKEEAVTLRSQTLLIQNREFSFWNRHADQLKRAGKQLLFTCSDLLAPPMVSQTHSFDSFCQKGLPDQNEPTRRELAEFLGHCAHVFAGSDAQADQLRRIAGDRCPSISVDGDPIDTATYRPGQVDRPDSNGTFRIVWEGYLDNMPLLTVCAEAIRQLATDIKLVVLIATSRERRTDFWGTRDNRQLSEQILGKDIVEFHEWNPQSISPLIDSANVGLSPAFLDDPFSAAKPHNKAVIYNYMNLPVVASPTRANRNYVENGLNGFLAGNTWEWLDALRTLAQTPSLARQMGERGHQIAIEYEPRTVVSRMAATLAGLTATPLSIGSRGVSPAKPQTLQTRQTSKVSS